MVVFSPLCQVVVGRREGTLILSLPLPGGGRGLWGKGVAHVSSCWTDPSDSSGIAGMVVKTRINICGAEISPVPFNGDRWYKMLFDDDVLPDSTMPCHKV